MSAWLQSGLRRDVCVVVAARGTPTGQECKRAIEERYGRSVRPRTFYGALEKLVDGGYLHKEADGIHDRYRLTDAGERALRDHHAWVGDALD